MGVGRPGLAGGMGLGMKRTGLHTTTFNAPLMTFTSVMFFPFYHVVAISFSGFAWGNGRRKWTP